MMGVYREIKPREKSKEKKLLRPAYIAERLVGLMLLNVSEKSKKLCPSN